MNHELVNYLDQKLEKYVSDLGLKLSNLGNSIGIAGSNINLSVKSLSEKIDNYSKSSDNQARRMYWLTWALVGTGVLHLLVFIVQSISQINN